MAEKADGFVHASNPPPMSASQHAHPRNHIRGYIPIRPDLLQFVVWRENLPEKTTPLVLPGQGAICAFLGELIQFARIVYQPMFEIEREPLDLPHLSERLRFECAPGFIDESFFRYADLIAHFFNDFLHQQWKEEVEIWVEACLHCAPHTDRKEAIAQLHEKSGVGHLREWDSEIRANHRFRTHRGKVARKRAPKTRPDHESPAPSPLLPGLFLLS